MTDSKTQQFRITYLADIDHHIPLLTQWFINEWQPYYGSNGPGDAQRDLLECCQKDKLPLGLVAIDEDGDPAGTIALKAESVGSDSAKGPWLAAFLVDARRRRQGIGSTLVEAMEQEALRLGYSEIYASTDTARNLLECRQWSPWGYTQSLGGPIPIYRKSLQPQSDRG
ncbi:MAG: GNAT family N-acetyltransferase [Fimbriimonadaceae bacterium]|nr:GNAT family N-acetyltransferase [Alphaproteobacteria bacterium]